MPQAQVWGGSLAMAQPRTKAGAETLPRGDPPKRINALIVIPRCYRAGCLEFGGRHNAKHANQSAFIGGAGHHGMTQLVCFM